MKNPPDKIRSIVSLSKTVASLKRLGRKVVLCHGVFDLIHAGHIRHFQSAKKYGDTLVVTLTDDAHVRKGPGRPYFNEKLRAEVIASLADVDYVCVVPFDSAIEVILRIKPDAYIKGPDYKNRPQALTEGGNFEKERTAVESYGGKLVFTDDEVVFSSSKLLNDYLDPFPERIRSYIREMKKNTTSEMIISTLSNIKKLKILLIGDAIIDQYHYCVPMGKSSKEPIMVHRFLSEENFLGGVLATSNHVMSLVDSVTLLTTLGKKNSFESFIRRKLHPGVKPKFFFHEHASTIIKRRFLEIDIKQKIFQVTILDQENMSSDIEERILRYLKAHIREYDGVIINDFGHGIYTPKIASYLSKNSRYLCLNVQANSANYGFNVVTKYPSADYICVDEQEIRLALHDKSSDIDLLIQNMYRKMKCKAVTVTRGPHGSVYYSKNAGYIRTPAFSDKIIDRMGAGDAFFAFTSPCLIGKIPDSVIPFVGNVAAALKVQIIGNRKAVDFDSLKKYIIRLMK